MREPTVKDLQGYGRAIKKARIQKGFTQEQVGEMCGVTGDMIGKIERAWVGPKPQTSKRLEEVLGVSVKKFRDDGGLVMEGLQELTDQVRLLMQKLDKGDKDEGSRGPTLPDASNAKGDKAQLIKAVADLQGRVEQLEDGAHNPGAVEDEVEVGKETPDEVIDKLLSEHEDMRKEGVFKDFDGSFFGESSDERKFKAQLYVDCCNICDELNLDAFEQVKSGFLSGSVNRAEAMRDVLVDFCTDDISKDDARKELEKLLKPETLEEGGEHEWDFE